MVVRDHQPKRHSNYSFPKRHSKYSFYPKERDVIKYLLVFAIDEPLLEQYQYMQLVDLYADKEPWEILEGTNTNAGYMEDTRPSKGTV
ncbi:hypothetical protein RDI58_002313 [Solanum bulbocastanum]|uniref:NAC domain-containing protein n=1 Tax=Solanum bulbocastanum TaxID=147425 RepID=A0AAN8U6I9_SOLBU